MAANTTALIKALRERVNKILTTYYEEAPSKDAVFPYAVINGVNIIDLAAGDLASFYLDIWVDEKPRPSSSRAYATHSVMSLRVP